MTTRVTAQELVSEVIDRLCTSYTSDIKDYYGDDVNIDDTTPLDIVQNITVHIEASLIDEVYLVFELDKNMSNTVLKTLLSDKVSAVSFLSACQIELSRYQKVAGATTHV